MQQSIAAERTPAIGQHRLVLGEFFTVESMKSYMCVICGFVYNEADGLPEEGIAPGTKWQDVPPNWVCPDCGARKEDFEMVEI